MTKLPNYVRFNIYGFARAADINWLFVLKKKMDEKLNKTVLLKAH